MSQREWHEGMIEEVFKTKANFNRLRNRPKTVYNGRSALMRERGLNAVTVKPVWNALTQVEQGNWSHHGKQLTLHADVFCVFGMIHPYFRVDKCK